MQQHISKHSPTISQLPTLYVQWFSIQNKIYAPNSNNRLLFGLGLPTKPARDHLYNSWCHPGLFLIQKVIQALSRLRAIKIYIPDKLHFCGTE